MAIKKLVVQTAIVTEDHSVDFEAGMTWPLFVDPETGNIYEPKDGFEVTGKNLEDLFERIEGGDGTNSQWLEDLEEVL